MRPQSFGEILNGAFMAIRFNPSVTIGLPAIVLLVGTVFFSVGTWSIFGQSDLFDPTTTTPQAFTEERIGGTITGLLLGGVLLWVSSMIANAFVMVAASRAVLGEKISPRETWELVRGRIPAVLTYSILTSVAMSLALLLVVAIIFGAASVSAEFGVLTGIAGTLLGLGAVIYLSIKLLLAPAAIVLERIGPIAGLKRGWVLVKGRFWWIFLLYFVGSLIISVVGQVFAFPLGIIAGIVPALWPSLAGLAISISNGLSTFLGSLLGAAFLGSFIALIYTDQRMRLEGLDITLMNAAQKQD